MARLGGFTPSAGYGGLDSIQPVAPPAVRGRVTIWAPETGQFVTGRYVEPPTVDNERAASGGWTNVARAQLRPLTQWVGHQPLKIQAKILFDGWTKQRAIDGELEQVRGFQERLRGDDAERRPPFVRIVGVSPGHYDNVKWVIDNLETSEEKWKDGECRQSTVTLTLLEFLPPTDTERVEKKRKRAHKYTWRRQDTLEKVAKKELGSSGSQARAQIRKANPKVKRWTKVPAGKRITIPAVTTVDR